MAARAFRVLQLNVLLISFALIFFSKNDRNLLFGSRRESLKPGSISRLRASCQQLDSESDKEKSSLHSSPWPETIRQGDLMSNLASQAGYGSTTAPDWNRGFYISWL